MKTNKKNTSTPDNAHLSFFHDGWRKFIALILGFTIWLFWHNSHTEKYQPWKTITNVSLTVEDPTGKIFIDRRNLATTVNLKVGINLGSDIGESLNANDFRIRININELASTTGGITKHTQLPIKLTEKYVVEKPGNASVISFEPAVITIDADCFIEKELPVTFEHSEPWLSHEDMERYQIDYKLLDDTVTVRGPSHIVEELYDMKTSHFTFKRSDLSRVPFTRTITLDASHLEPSNAFTVIPQEVKLSVSAIDKYETTDHRFKNIPVLIVQNQDQRLTITNLQNLPKSIEANLTVPKGIEKNLENTLKAFIDLTPYFAPGTYSVKIEILNLPPGVVKTFQTLETATIELSAPASPSKTTSVNTNSPTAETATNESVSPTTSSTAPSTDSQSKEPTSNE